MERVQQEATKMTEPKKSHPATDIKSSDLIKMKIGKWFDSGA